MKCDSCEEKATVFYTQVTDGKLKKFVLCESCAKAKGITNPDGLLMAEEALKPLVVGGPEPEGFAPQGQGECPTCGFTISDLQKVGRLGCPDCYRAFASEIGHRLSSLHKGVVHVGHVPAGLAQQRELKNRISELEEKLGAAVSEERYEDAAVVRDELEQLKSGGEVSKS
ncbi:UvrB/UvrC motif-containing protein [Verrucomicrobiaceae bacterium 227]